jgi:DNA polymerase-4
MPVILTTPAEVETWMTAPSDEALKLQRPLPGGELKIVVRDLTEFEVMLSELQSPVDKVWRHYEDKGARGRTVTLKVKFADFELISRSRTFVGAIGSRDELESSSAELLTAFFPLEKAVRPPGVAISGFSIVAIGRSEQIAFAL